MLTVVCPGCRVELTYDPAHAGGPITCGRCGEIVWTPDPTQAARPRRVLRLAAAGAAGLALVVLVAVALYYRHQAAVVRERDTDLFEIQEIVYQRLATSAVLSHLHTFQREYRATVPGDDHDLLDGFFKQSFGSLENRRGYMGTRIIDQQFDERVQKLDTDLTAAQRRFVEKHGVDPKAC